MDEPHADALLDEDGEAASQAQADREESGEGNQLADSSLGEAGGALPAQDEGAVEGVRVPAANSRASSVTSITRRTGPSFAQSVLRVPSPPENRARSSGPPMGASIDSLMLWRRSKERRARTAETSAASAGTRGHQGTGGRRSWLSSVPLSTKPNPPRTRFPSAQRPFQDRRLNTPLVLSESVSSAGLSWIDIDTINRKVLKSAPAVRFPTEPRHLGLSREQLQVATDHPAPNEYQSFKSSQVLALAQYHRAPTPQFSAAGRPTVSVEWGRGGTAVLTYGERTFTDETGINYSSFAKQRLSTARSGAASSFSVAKRRGFADTRDQPGPQDYEVVTQIGKASDALQRTRLRTPSQFAIPRERRPWQKPVKLVDDTALEQTQTGWRHPHPLSQHRNTVAVSIGKAPRRGCGGDIRDNTPGPASYNV